MGNENSHLAGLEIDEKAVEVSDFWSQHSASIASSEHVTSLTVLVGELFVNGTLWSNFTPLEKSSKNLMIYRHPCIIKYISSWKRNNKFYLALEDVKPLTHVLSTQNALQICIGLHSVLKALCFLHEKAHVSHNNVCTSSVYVAKDGNWKLAGMEYLCSYNNLSADYLNKSRPNRYSKSIDPNEEKNFQATKRKDVIDVFAFGTLVCEVLKSKSDEEICTLSSFRELCKTDLQNVNVMKRPKLSSLLDHPFFNHDFISIHSFLVELPLKSDEEKTAFFSSLPERLKSFDEALVASQLGGLLLSRMVLLNSTAQKELLPLILRPCRREEQNGLFSEETFKQHLIPVLLEIFCVRDAQIRLLLLNHFTSFMHCFSQEELQTCVLPELLLGIKDTNDLLVSVTLRTLADLVPVLGSSTVIGGKRAKLFNDGRPITAPSVGKSSNKKNCFKRTEVAPEVIQENVSVNTPSSGSDLLSNNILQSLPERPRPDGEEGETSTEEIEQSLEEELDNWEDWDLENNPTHLNPDNSVEQITEHEIEVVVEGVGACETNLPNLDSWDVKSPANSNEHDEFNFFEDMEPVIQRSSKFVVESDKFASKLNLDLVDDAEGGAGEAGWGDEDWE